jgi:hypothetical protein
MSVANGRLFARTVCEALGVDPKNVTRVVIELNASAQEPVRVTVEKFATIESVQTVTEMLALAKWELPKEPER